MTSITLRGVEKHFGTHQVLFDCNLDIADGEFVVLVGPSGSGKTTLLRIIAGLEDMTGGELRFGDRRVNEVDVGDRDIAMVFQNYGLYPHMSVYNNMAFGLRRRRMSQAEIDRRVRSAADMLNITAYLARKPRQLSGGQRQRVALGRAIVRDPQVFLLDEPLSNLDAHLRVQMRAEILRVHRAVTSTAVYVTHDQVEAMTMGDRIVVMNAGRIQQVGTPYEVYDAPVNRFVASFIGTPAMGFITGSLREGKVVTDSAEFRLSAEQLQAIGSRSHLELGIRPERLEPGEGGDWTVRGITDVVEMLGAEQYVHFTTCGGHLTARVPRDHRIRIGEPVTFTGIAGHLYIFDGETGERIASANR